MAVSDRFQKNLERWAVYCPKEAKRVSLHSCQAVTLCTTGGELNLKRHATYFHSPQGALAEAEKWFAGLDLYGINTVFVYGVGLGYYYLAAKQWLEEGDTRALIFLEDDLDVLYSLMQTELAGELLQAEKVRLYYVPPEEGKIKLERFDELPGRYFLYPLVFSALGCYLKEQPEKVFQFQNALDYLKNVKISQEMEYMSFGTGFFRNFYSNMLKLPDNKLGNLLFNKFKGVPAIICGAGPSLEEQLPLLGKLKDRALIFAGGSAMNTVNANGFLPHFGVTIDPNSSQYTRMYMNQAYEVPYFYRNRAFPGAIDLQHGEHLYISGSEGYELPKLIEERLGIHEQELPEGGNVVNFSLAIAQAMGCSPLILVGVDLAYSRGKSYASGIIPHPILSPGQMPITRNPEEELIEKEDIHGRPVLTLWKWIAAASWISEFAASHPEQTIVNASGEGIGMQGVSNLSLKEVEDKYLNRSFEIPGLVHAAIQESSFPPHLNQQKILETLAALIAELNALKSKCAELKTIFEKIIEEEVIPPLTADLIRRLKEEPLYDALLKQFNETYLYFYGHGTPGKEIIRQALRNKGRFAFLEAVCLNNISQIKKCLEVHRKSEELLKPPVAENPRNVQRSMDEPREGTSKVYSSQGVLLSDINYVDGVPDGKGFFFYPTGALFSVQQFKKGVWEGRQEFFYPDGTLKSTLDYQTGQLHGLVELYFSNGRMKRQISFKEGKRNGMEITWDVSGSKESEVGYWQDKPVGVARSWYPNGQIVKEIDYDHNFRPTSIKLWTGDGVQLPSKLLYRPDRYEKVTKQAGALADSIGGISDHMGAMMLHLPEGDLNLKNEMNELQQQTESLRNFHREMVSLASEASDETKEALWKNPETMRLFGKQMDEAKGKIAKDMAAMQEAFKRLADLLKKKPPESP